jgi:glutamyl-tRNA synthetase
MPIPHEAKARNSTGPLVAKPSGPTVVGRLAPSPSGHLHLGHARTFLFAWWSARSQSGQVVLRIEDIDGQRCRPELIDDCIRDLEWLGLDWDIGPRRQSTGLARITAAAQHLQQKGAAYACVHMRADVMLSASAPQQGQREARYPGTCRGRFRDRLEAQELTGKSALLRFAVAPGRVKVRDAIFGDCEFDVSGQVGDFPVLGRDGTPTYQLAVVVDDAQDGVTEVVRGADLLASAARQQLLYEALGFMSPKWIHVPLVLDAAGRRLAKRADDVSLSCLRQRNVDPRSIVAWAARSAGLTTGERPMAHEVTGAFDISRIPSGPVCAAPDALTCLGCIPNDPD